VIDSAEIQIAVNENKYIRQGYVSFYMPPSYFPFDEAETTSAVSAAGYYIRGALSGTTLCSLESLFLFM
jgi:hypothetical protein